MLTQNHARLPLPRSLSALILIVPALGCLILPGCSGDNELSPPAAPAGLSAVAVSESEIRLTWTDLSDNEQGFEVHESVADSAHFSAVTSVEPNTGTTLLTGRQPNTTYYYIIRAFNPAGESAFSDIAVAATVNVPPTAPSGLTGQIVNGTDIRLEWQDHSALEDGFRLYQWSDQDTVYAQQPELAPNTDTLWLNDLEPETAYRYRLSAFNTFGESGFTESGALTTGVPTLLVHIWITLELPEIPVGVNLPINGRVTTLHGTPQRGVQVFFAREPQEIGRITPFARTEPDSANGFRIPVTFNGLTDGLAKIIAHIEDDTHIETARDSLYVWVIP